MIGKAISNGFAGAAGAALLWSVCALAPATAAAAFDAANATYAFAGSTFTLSDGKAQIMGQSGLPDAPDTPIPIGYTLAASASGDITGDGGASEAVALYRGFGANLQWVVLFGFADQSGTYEQVAASAAYQGDAKVESVSVDKGKVSLDLLVVSDADKQKPHYEQKPTQPLTFTFAIQDGAFVAQQ
jgi:hypothetical protein